LVDEFENYQKILDSEAAKKKINHQSEEHLMTEEDEILFR
jgi:hypothetical protein